MEYSKLLDLATELGYELAMNGAETFRVEESVFRVLAAYEIEAEVFVIPNCMHISIEPVIGRPQTRMRRIGMHGNDLDAVERFSNLSRRICQERPAPEIAAKWLAEAKSQKRQYSFLWYLSFSLFIPYQTFRQLTLHKVSYDSESAILSRDNVSCSVLLGRIGVINHTIKVFINTLLKCGTHTLACLQ